MTSPIREDGQRAKPGESQHSRLRENSEWTRRTERVVSVKKEGVRIFKHTGGPGAAKRLSFFFFYHTTC